MRLEKVLYKLMTGFTEDVNELPRKKLKPILITIKEIVNEYYEFEKSCSYKNYSEKNK